MDPNTQIDAQEKTIAEPTPDAYVEHEGFDIPPDLNMSFPDGSQAPAEAVEAPTEGKADETAEQLTDTNTTAEQSLAELASFTVKPEEKLASIERQLAESSKNGRELNDQLKSVTEMLENQGLKLSFDDGQVALDISGESGKSPNIEWDNLPENLRDDLEADPEKALSKLVSHVSSKIVTPKPSRVEKPARYEPELIGDALDALVASEESGMGYERLKDNAPHIKSMLKEPLTDDYKDVMARHPKLGLILLNTRINGARSRFQEHSQSESPEAGPQGSYGGGAEVRTSNQMSPEQQSEAMAKLIASAQ